MNANVLTAAEFRRAIEQLGDNRPAAPCPHIVHPRYAEMERVYEYRDGDLMTGCAALCGTVLVFRPKATP